MVTSSDPHYNLSWHQAPWWDSAKETLCSHWNWATIKFKKGTLRAKWHQTPTSNQRMNVTSKSSTKNQTNSPIFSERTRLTWKITFSVKVQLTIMANKTTLNARQRRTLRNWPKEHQLSAIKRTLWTLQHPHLPYQKDWILNRQLMTRTSSNSVTIKTSLHPSIVSLMLIKWQQSTYRKIKTLWLKSKKKHSIKRTLRSQTLIPVCL